MKRTPLAVAQLLHAEQQVRATACAGVWAPQHLAPGPPQKVVQISLETHTEAPFLQVTAGRDGAHASLAQGVWQSLLLL